MMDLPPRHRRAIRWTVNLACLGGFALVVWNAVEELNKPW